MAGELSVSAARNDLQVCSASAGLMTASVLCIRYAVIWLGQRSASTLSMCFCRAMNSTRFDKVKVVILGQGGMPHASQHSLPPCNLTCTAVAGLLFRYGHCTTSKSLRQVLKAVNLLAADPYHNTGQAMGLSFSVPQGTPVPSSLQNIYKELNTDLGCTRPKHGCLLKVTRH